MENEESFRPGFPLDEDDAPILDERFFANAGIRIDGKIIKEATDTQARRGRPPQGTAPKIQQSLRLSPEVLEHFRATGEGWQGRIDEVLRAHVAGQRADKAA